MGIYILLSESKKEFDMSGYLYLFLSLLFVQEYIPPSLEKRTLV